MYGKITDFAFGFETRSLISSTANCSETSIIERSSNSTVRGITFEVFDGDEKIPSSETSLISVCPEKATIAIATANAATTIPTMTLGFNI